MCTQEISKASKFRNLAGSVRGTEYMGKLSRIYVAVLKNVLSTKCILYLCPCSYLYFHIQ